MVILAAGDGVLQGCLAVAGSVSQNNLAAGRARFVRPFWGANRTGQLIVRRTLRQWRSEVDPVAIQVDIFVRDTSQPVESIRVDRMNQQCRNPWRQTRRLIPCEPVDLRARAGKTLDTVGG